MAIIAGNDALAADFIDNSAGAGDSGKGVKLNSDGKLDITILQNSFGGDGSDGALNTTGGVVDINLGGAAVVIKNYTSIIINTNNLTFSNPHANGTIVILKSQGNVTIKTKIDLKGIGAAAQTTGYAIMDDDTHDGNVGVAGSGNGSNGGAGGAAGTVLTNLYPYTTVLARIFQKSLIVAAGSGGGNGGIGEDNPSSGGAGGRGGGVLLLECAGALDFDVGGEIDMSGGNGGNGVAGGSDGYGGGGGGGGGSCGMTIILYNTLTDNSGTLIVDGGNSGDGGAGNGGGSGCAGGGGGSGAGHRAAGATGAAGGTSNVAGTNGNAGSNGSGAGGAGGGGRQASGGNGASGGASTVSTLIIKNTEFA